MDGGVGLRGGCCVEQRLRIETGNRGFQFTLYVSGMGPGRLELD
jgi:hypothetical protein